MPLTRITGHNVAYFDCDDTLVMWAYPYSQEEGSIEFYADNQRLWLHPHREHINALKAHKNRGGVVVVWSAGGEEWAHEVVRGLGLTEYVDATVAKPARYYDDLRHDEVLPAVNRVYFPWPGSVQGKF